MRKNKTIRITIDLPMSFPKDWDNEIQALKLVFDEDRKINEEFNKK